MLRSNAANDLGLAKAFLAEAVSSRAGALMMRLPAVLASSHASFSSGAVPLRCQDRNTVIAITMTQGDIAVTVKGCPEQSVISSSPVAAWRIVERHFDQGSTAPECQSPRATSLEVGHDNPDLQFAKRTRNMHHQQARQTARKEHHRRHEQAPA